MNMTDKEIENRVLSISSSSGFDKNGSRYKELLKIANQAKRYNAASALIDGLEPLPKGCGDAFAQGRKRGHDTLMEIIKAEFKKLEEK